VFEPERKTIVHIPNVNSRESTKDKIKEVSTSSMSLVNGKARMKKRLSSCQNT
jgi:hypothetical protein